MRYTINETCNVLTDNHCKRYHRPGTRPIEITIPEFRANLYIHDAERLVKHLTAALTAARTLENQPTDENNA